MNKEKFLASITRNETQLKHRSGHIYYDKVQIGWWISLGGVDRWEFEYTIVESEGVRQGCWKTNPRCFFIPMLLRKHADACLHALPIRHRHRTLIGSRQPFFTLFSLKQHRMIYFQIINWCHESNVIPKHSQYSYKNKRQMWKTKTFSYKEKKLHIRYT